jgi:probable rRNA maturation factor
MQNKTPYNKGLHMVEVNNRTRKPIREAFLKKVAEVVLTKEKVPDKNLSIALVEPAESKRLNKTYRKKDKAANVLSFPGENESMPGETGAYLGEVILCPSEIEKDAKKYGMIFEQALAWMLIHGILHVIGLDHKTEQEARAMEKKEHLYLKTL